jgi:hypothetical protein
VDYKQAQLIRSCLSCFLNHYPELPAEPGYRGQPFSSQQAMQAQPGRGDSETYRPITPHRFAFLLFSRRRHWRKEMRTIILQHILLGPPACAKCASAWSILSRSSCTDGIYTKLEVDAEHGADSRHRWGDRFKTSMGRSGVAVNQGLMEGHGIHFDGQEHRQE